MPHLGGSVMRRAVRIAPLVVLLVGLRSALGQAAEPLPTVFDTDLDSDCDDAGALALLHTLADRGEAKILATTVSSKHPWAAACVDGINTYHGRPDIPIGVPKGSGPKEQGSRFARQ